MNDQPILTDAALEAMLARRAGPAAPAGLAESIGDALAALPEDRRPWWSVLAPPAGRNPALRLAWVVAVVGLLMAATVSAVFVGSELLRRSSQLTVVPSPTVVPAPSAAPSAGPAFVSRRPIQQVSDLAFAADGSLWLATGAGVVHWDVAKGSATLYGQNEGLPATTVLQVAVAPDGGVWAGGGTWLARFDGSWTAFTEFGAAGRVKELGGLAFGQDGTLATAARADGDGLHSYLLRYGGRWSATEIAGVDDLDFQAGCGRLGVAPDGTVWVGTCSNGVIAFDGSRWTQYDAASTGLPDDPWLAGVAPDGAVWVVMPELCESETSCSNPGHGVARFDGTRWTVYSTESGLADPDVHLEIGRDGLVWATYGFVPSSVSRFDGTRWVTVEEPELAYAHAQAAAPDGALWLSSADGLLRYDGTTVTRHALPTVEVERDLPPLKLTLASGPTVIQSALGTITVRVYESPPEHNFFYGMVGTAHGPVVSDGPDLRWLSSEGAWEGTTVPLEAWNPAAAGEDLIGLDHGRAVRLSWDGTGWAPGDMLEWPASLGYVYQVVAGPRGTVAAGGTSIAWSTDGLHFAEAVRGPVVTAPPPGATGGELVKIGPVFATRDGFVALAPADSVSISMDHGLEPKVWFSADGSTWDLVGSTSPFGEGAYVWDVSSWGGRHVAVGWETSSGSAQRTGAAWVSDDGLAWERLPALERAEPCVDECELLLTGVAAAESGWMILARDGAAWTSSDGRTWEPLRGWPGVTGMWSPPSLALSPGTIVVSGVLGDPWRDVVVVGTIEP